MKRNEKLVPGFDEIIFENRNMEYGAYILRKNYKSAASISILAAAVISTLALILLLLDSKPATASDHTGIIDRVLDCHSCRSLLR